MRHVVVFALAALIGCIGIRPGAPLPATTVGKGKVSLAFIGEGPAIQPNPDDQNANASGTTYRLGQLSTVATSVSLAVGISDDTDVELSAEGAGILLLLGGSLGVRHHVGASELFDFAIATQVGGLWVAESSRPTRATERGSTKPWKASRSCGAAPRGRCSHSS